MEMLQQRTERKPQQLTSLNLGSKDVSCCGGGQGSPIPGDPASPPGGFQHSPSLPASGLTELSASDSVTWNDSSAELQELPAAKGSVRSTGAPRRQYVGVRVKMPVRELLKKIRLSRGIQAKDTEEPSTRAGLPKSSRTTGKTKVPPRKRLKQSRRQTPAALKSEEDLDILEEVLQEDLHQSHAKMESDAIVACGVDHHGGPPELWPPFEESHPLPESSWEAIRFQPRGSTPHSGVLLHPQPDSEDLYPGCRMKQFDVSNPHQHPYIENGAWQESSTGQHSVESFQGLSRDTQRFACPSLGGPLEPALAEEDAAAVLHGGGCSKPSPGAFMGQAPSALSFFQFQLCHEESRLRKVPLDKLFVPDKNGDRLLHRAVRQGKRALAYALAWKFAYRQKIDEKDAAQQTALHVAAQQNHHLIFRDLISLGANVNARDGSKKTPLHICAENGYVKILEVLKNCRAVGIRVELGAVDHRGLTAVQCAFLAHSTFLLAMEHPGLPLERHKALAQREEQLLAGIHCLVQMGAETQDQDSFSPTGPDERAAPYLEGNDQALPLRVF